MYGGSFQTLGGGLPVVFGQTSACFPNGLMWPEHPRKTPPHPPRETPTHCPAATSIPACAGRGHCAVRVPGVRVLWAVLESSLPLLLFELPQFVQAEFLPDVLAFRKYVTSSALLNPEKLKLFPCSTHASLPIRSGLRRSPKCLEPSMQFSDYGLQPISEL